MKRVILTTMILFLIATIGYGFKTIDPHFTKKSNGLISSEIHKLLFLTNYPYRLYAHDGERVYVSFNKGEAFDVLMQKGWIHDLYSNEEVLFIAADDGVYVLDLKDDHLEKIFNVSANNTVFAIAEHKGSIYIGSKIGVHKKESFGAYFVKIKDADTNNPSYQLFSSAQHLFLADKKALYLLNTNGEFKQVFKVGIDKEEGGSLIKDLIIQDDLCVLATARGIYISDDVGQTWQLLNGININFDDITSLLAMTTVMRSHGVAGEESLSLDGLLIGTLHGLYEYRDGDVRRLYKGLESEVIHDLVEADGEVYVATDRGIFTVDGEQGAAPNVVPVDLTKLKQNEPTIAMVHGWAIDYAEVHPQKISEWRRLSKKKALFPNLSLGVDGGRDWSRSNSLWGSSSGSLLIGPDDKGSGEDFGWDVSLSWDLSDFIWSTDQTTIDGRSKLMVELREDILAQVTRLYFERRRLAVELVQHNAFDKQLRFEELTAHLDAYTGGEFSRYINRNSEKQ